MPGDPDSLVTLVDELTGPRASELVAPLLPRGSTLRALEVRQVLGRDASRATVRYDVEVEWPDGLVTGEVVAALCDRRGLPEGEGVLRARVGDGEVALFRVEDDPLLPGLRRALDPAFARVVAEDAGFARGDAEVSLRAYRPGRRAVVEARFTGLTAALKPGKAYLKVLPAEEAAEVAARYERLDGVLPIAEHRVVLPGVLLLRGVPGLSLGRALKRGRPLPLPESLAGLVDDLARVPLADLGSEDDDAGGDPGSEVAARRLRRHSAVLRAALPDEGPRLERIAAAVGELAPQPVVTVHGDLHEGQVLVVDGAISGVLDVDGAGPGQAVDDLALMLGRIHVLAEESGDRAARRYATALGEAFGELVDPTELRRRVTIALLGRATGPHRNNLPDWPARVRGRLAVAERWAAELG